MNESMICHFFTIALFFYRDNRGDFLGAFAYNLGDTNSLIAELNGAMYAIELAALKGWGYLTSFWWDDLPPQIREAYTRNKLGLPYFRFC
jgi:hypothetical protein